MKLESCLVKLESLFDLNLFGVVDLVLGLVVGFYVDGFERRLRIGWSALAAGSRI